MPRRAKGPRLYRDPTRGQYVIRDGSRFVRLGAASPIEAEKHLAEYIASKYRPTPSGAPLVADILSAYATDIAAHRKTAVNISYNIGNLLKWWGEKPASEITARNCRAYASTKKDSAAAQDLKVLRAAVGHWSREYAAINPPPVIWKPREGRPRERWLTRAELARLLQAARRMQHLRRFILLAYYQGCSQSKAWQLNAGHGRRTRMLYDPKWEQKTNSPTRSVLIAARALIEKPENWVNHSPGEEEEQSGKRCAARAIWCSAYRPDGDDAFQALRKAMGNVHVPAFNDTHTHAEVLAAFDRAIAAT